MATATCQVPLPKMVDLALGSPEVGTINFNVLHNLLHVVLQQMGLQNTLVEFRGADCKRVESLLSQGSPGPTLTLTEYAVTGDKPTKKPPANAKRKRSTLEEVEVSTIESKKSKSSVGSKKSDSALNTVVIVEEKDPNPKIPRLTVTVSQERFMKMEKDIDNLHKKLRELIELPSNAAILEAIKGNSSENPVVDMWQALHMFKRIESAEQGMEKLASMLEDFVRGVGIEGVGEASFEKGESTISASEGKKPTLTASKEGIFGEVYRRLEILEKYCGLKSGQGSRGSTAGSAEQAEDADDDVEVLTAAESGGKWQEQINNLKTSILTLEHEMSSLKKALGTDDLSEGIREMLSLNQKALALQVETKEGSIEAEEESLTKIGGIEEKLNALDESLNTTINTLQVQLIDIEKELGALQEKLNISSSGAVCGPPNIGLNEMFDTIQRIQQDLEDLIASNAKLSEDQEKRREDVDALVEEIELIKTSKADREDLEDALADKADAYHMNRKVSHDQFDAACDDLTKGIEDAFAKLIQQEQMWANALEEIQQAIGSKLDKMEFDPLRDFVNNKIAKLQERLKQLIALKKEQEAAGSKSRFLRNINCISCDKDVIMHKFNQHPTLPTPEPMPGTKSMRPYLSYELDQVRKQKKCLPHGRNLHHLESAIQEEKTARKQPPTKLPPAADHLCNRYCGGSHTVTTPYQRVTRIGHFLTQWGPEAVPLQETTIMGKDGQIYRARETGDGPSQTPRDAPVRLSKHSAIVQTDDVSPSKISQVRRSSARGSAESKTQEPTSDEKESDLKLVSAEKRGSGTKKSDTSQARGSGSIGKGDEPRGSGSLKGSPKGSKGSIKKTSTSAVAFEKISPAGSLKEAPAEGSKTVAAAPEPSTEKLGSKGSKTSAGSKGSKTSAIKEPSVPTIQEEPAVEEAPPAEPPAEEPPAAEEAPPAE